MSFFAKIMAAFTGKAPTGSDRYLPLYVIDHRCREPISGQVDLLNELSLAEEEGGGYYVRKVLHTSGASRCFGQVEVQVWLDGKKQITRYEIQGGRWLTAEEFAAEMGRRTAEAEAAAVQATAAEAATEDVQDGQASPVGNADAKPVAELTESNEKSKE